MRHPVALGALLAFIGFGILGANNREIEERRVASLTPEQVATEKQERLEREAAAAKKQRQKDCSDTMMAFVMSQKFVKGRLKAPSTAKFPYISSEGVSSTRSGDCKFLVIAYVDAQNAFGAMLRQKYLARMEYDPSSRLWRAKEVVM